VFLLMIVMCWVDWTFVCELLVASLDLASIHVVELCCVTVLCGSFLLVNLQRMNVLCVSEMIHGGDEWAICFNLSLVNKV
jgi:hypothetical protein